MPTNRRKPPPEGLGIKKPEPPPAPPAKKPDVIAVKVDMSLDYWKEKIDEVAVEAVEEARSEACNVVEYYSILEYIERFKGKLYNKFGIEREARSMRRHKYFKCDCNEVHCQYCEGGLAFCTVCKGGEGSLTTECCGRPLTDDEEDRIYIERTLNFKDGKWVNKGKGTYENPIGK